MYEEYLQLISVFHNLFINSNTNLKFAATN